MLFCPMASPENGTPEIKAGPQCRVVWRFRSLGTIFKMIIFTKYLHEAIRNGLECECYPIPSLSKERDGEHYPGCRWAAYKDEIYRLERREEKIMAAFERSSKKFPQALAALAKE